MSNYPITLNGFLALHKHKDGEVITHTKIGNASMGIYGGKYSIPDETMDDFWKLYHKDVLFNNICICHCSVAVEGVIKG